MVRYLSLVTFVASLFISSYSVQAAVSSEVADNCAVANVNAVDAEGMSLASLFIPSCSVQAAVSSEMADKNISTSSANAVHSPDMTTLMCTIIAGDLAKVCSQLELGANLEALDMEGSTSLMGAVEMMTLEKHDGAIVAVLLQADANPNAQDGMPLIRAVWNSNAGAADVLLKAGANIDLRGLGSQRLHDVLNGDHLSGLSEDRRRLQVASMSGMGLPVLETAILANRDNNGTIKVLAKHDVQMNAADITA